MECSIKRYITTTGQRDTNRVPGINSEQCWEGRGLGGVWAGLGLGLGWACAGLGLGLGWTWAGLGLDLSRLGFQRGEEFEVSWLKRECLKRRTTYNARQNI